MATFSDLMNLLLCFFVLLFAMSSVDEEKFTAVSQSLAQTFNIFQAGSQAVGDGFLVSSGSSQLSNLDEYYTTMGEQADAKEDDDLFQQNSQVKPGDITQDVENTPAKDDNQIITPPQDIITDAENAIFNANKDQTSDMYDEITDLVDDFNMSDYLDLDVDAEKYEYVQIQIKGNVLFDTGSIELKDEAKSIVAKIGDILRIYPDCNVEIIGHTDNTPVSYQNITSNNLLSTARAISVAEYLINEKGIDESRVKFSGRGSYEPIASNDTEEGRRLNRRVEIRLYNALSSKK